MRSKPLAGFSGLTGFAIAASLLWACTSEETVVTHVGAATPDGSAALDGSATPDAAEAGAPVASPREECELYLDCINDTEPTQGGATVALYGNDSPCWKSSAADFEALRRCVPCGAYGDPPPGLEVPKLRLLE